MATNAAFEWSAGNLACLATYNILEGDDLLNQFDAMFLDFKAAGAVRLASLPYFPKFEAAPEDLEGRAAQMARRYFKFLVLLFTPRNEQKRTTISEIRNAFAADFASDTARIRDLAQTADRFLKFANER